MPVITEEERGLLKEKINGLNLFSAKQVLLGLIQIIEKRPTIKTAELMDLVDEAVKLSGLRKDVGDN